MYITALHSIWLKTAKFLYLYTGVDNQHALQILFSATSNILYSEPAFCNLHFDYKAFEVAGIFNLIYLFMSRHEVHSMNTHTLQNAVISTCRTQVDITHSAELRHKTQSMFFVLALRESTACILIVVWQYWWKISNCPMQLWWCRHNWQGWTGPIFWKYNITYINKNSKIPMPKMYECTVLAIIGDEWRNKLGHSTFFWIVAVCCSITTSLVQSQLFLKMNKAWRPWRPRFRTSDDFRNRSFLVYTGAVWHSN